MATKELVEATLAALRPLVDEESTVEVTEGTYDALAITLGRLATHALALEAEFAELREATVETGPGYIRCRLCEYTAYNATVPRHRDTCAAEAGRVRAVLLSGVEQAKAAKDVTEAKARALEEAAEAIERDIGRTPTEDAAAIRAASATASWLRSRAADVRAGR